MGVLGLFVIAACFVTETSARTTVTRLDRDYSDMKPQDVLDKHVESVMNRLYKLSGTNMIPRMQHLYEMLKKENYYQEQVYHAWEILDQRTYRPKYDVYKLNRIYTTEADG